MKKKLCMILSVITMLTCVFSVKVLAAAPKISIATGKINGDTLSIYVYLDNCVNLTSADFVLSYNASVLELDSVKSGADSLILNDISNNQLIMQTNEASSNVRIGFYFGSPLKLSAANAGGININHFEVLTVTFNVKNLSAKNVTVSTSSAEMYIGGLINSPSSSLKFNISDVAKEKSIKGDIDSDGRVTSADARLALRCAVGLTTLSSAQKKAADCDSDGKITAADARLILRCAVGLTKL